MPVKYLFVGGPFDGQWLKTNGNYYFTSKVREKFDSRVPLNLNITTSETATYERKCITVDERMFHFYVPCGVKDVEAIIILLKGYKPC